MSREDVKEVAYDSGGVLLELLENLGGLVDEQDDALGDNVIVPGCWVVDEVINQAGEEGNRVLMQIVFLDSIKQ